MYTQTNPDGLPKKSVASIAAAGSTQATATATTAAINVVSAADATKGVILPATTVIRDKGVEVIVVNNAAAILKVYPSGAAGTIDGGSAAASVNIAASKRAKFVCTAANTWFSLQSA